MIVFFSATVLSAEDSEKAQSFVGGGFEMSGFFSAGFGWQKFAGGPPTEWVNDGSFAGVLGSVVPEVATGVPPAQGEDVVEAFVEVFELDIAKQFGERANLAAHIWFGRPFSGSWVQAPGVEIEQAYATVKLSESHDVEFTLGRIGTPAGFEPYEPYSNDTISWSILSRANLYPYLVTGAQLSAALTESFWVYVMAANGCTNDTTFKINDLPSWLASFVFYWGPEEKESFFSITPFAGPESDSNRSWTFGMDTTVSAWLTDNFQLGFQGLFRRDDGAGGPNTDYASGLLNLHWDMTDKFFSFLRYAYANQFDDGNGFLNLTGAKQQIHEASIGGGYWIADGMKLKLEARFDAILPSAGENQWVPGVAMSLVSAF